MPDFTPPADLREIHAIYTAESEKTSGPKQWSRIHVRVFYHAVDGTKTQVYEFDRNYSLMGTFEPFRQLKAGTWRYYALISPSYSTFQVLDLETFQIVATRPYPQRPVTQKMVDQYAGRTLPAWLVGKAVGDTYDGEGFCPSHFYVPDITETITSADMYAEHKDDAWLADSAQLLQGQGGFVAGCVWGDDSSSKLRYVDLSRISEGLVTEDERFGYWELPNDTRQLREHISIDGDSVQIQTALEVNLATGQVHSYYKSAINWAPEAPTATS